MVVGRRPPQEVALDVVNTPLLHFALVPRGIGSARSNQKAIVLGTFPVRLLCLRIIPNGLDDRRFEIVHDHSFGYPLKESKGITVQAQPGLDFLVEDELSVLVTAPGQGHDKGPGAAQFIGLRVNHLPGIAKVHLSFFARLTFHPYGDVGGERGESPDKAVHGGVGPLVALFFQAALDGGDLDVLFDQLSHQVAIGLHGRDVLWRQVPRPRLLQQSLKFFQRRQWPFQQPMGRGPLSIAFDSPAVNAGVALYLPVARTGTDMSQYFTDVHEIPPV